MSSFALGFSSNKRLKEGEGMFQNGLQSQMELKKWTIIVLNV